MCFPNLFNLTRSTRFKLTRVNSQPSILQHKPSLMIGPPEQIVSGSTSGEDSDDELDVFDDSLFNDGLVTSTPVERIKDNNTYQQILGLAHLNMNDAVESRKTETQCQNRTLCHRWDEIRSAAARSPLAQAVETLGQHMLAKANLEPITQTSPQEDMDRFCRTSVTLGTGSSSLFLSDILSLYHDPAEKDTTRAWLTDAIVSTLMENELQDTPQTHFQPISELMMWLSGDSKTVEKARAAMQSSIRQVEKQPNDTSISFPMADLSPQATSILIPYNPSGAHWVVIEARFDGKPEINLYNPVLPTGAKKKKQRGYALGVAMQEIPLLLHLASLRKGTKLHGYDWRKVSVSRVPCPQQSQENTDCALFAVYCMVRRARGKAFSNASLREDEDGRRAFGFWLRGVCADRLRNLCLAEGAGTTLWDMFGGNGDLGWLLYMDHRRREVTGLVNKGEGSELN